jgi:hypothetical protein
MSSPPLSAPATGICFLDELPQVDRDLGGGQRCGDGAILASLVANERS